MRARMRRRDFVRRLPVIPAGMAAGLSGATACAAGIPYLAPTPAPEGLAITRSALGPDRRAFIQTPGMDRPIYLHLAESGEWIALLARCTHAGCQPEVFTDRLVCPCHGSEFALSGDVLQGPAERPLTRYEVVENGDTLVVRMERRGR